MPHISITSSLYRTEKFLPNWRKNIIAFATKAQDHGLAFEINAIANDPTPEELLILNELAKETWFNLHTVPRESFYASWHRGVQVANAPVCTSWNVDDNRNPEAILDGLRLIRDEAGIVYFPFTYKRYVQIFGFDILVKQVVFDPPIFDQARFTKEMHGGPFFMFTKDVYETVGLFDESFKVSGDFDWCVRAAKVVPEAFAKSSVNAGIFEKRPGTLSGGHNPLQDAENKRIIGE
jgi:hypothetical protein